MSQAKNPEVKREDNKWFVALPLEDGRTVDATWKPVLT